jgi:hypothetical protein
MGLDTKTYWLTDRQSRCNFDFDFNDFGIDFVDSGAIKSRTYHPPLVIDISSLLLTVIKSTSITTKSLLRVIIPYYVTFSRIMAGVECMISLLSMLLSPASVLMSKVLWNSQFRVVSSQTQNFSIDFLVLWGIILRKRIASTKVLRGRNLTLKYCDG